jgi:hypothetical protein
MKSIIALGVIVVYVAYIALTIHKITKNDKD